mmetsp:Transcript_19392/g.60988  ORF Transcript_19392/g.60988 Transcript_19392/m.60988 type:complete len:286 (-) Transcript_19392:76-933(-)
MVRTVSKLLALAAAPAFAMASGTAGGDVVSMIQHEAKASQPNVELAVRQWIGHFYAMMKAKQDPLLSSCCKLAKETGLSPFLSWGMATAEQQEFWNDRECNAAVGANSPEEPSGTPNCETMAMLTSLVPKSLARNPIELYSADSTCSEEDRMQINSTFLSDDPPAGLTPDCAPSSIVGQGKVNYATFQTCITKLLDVSRDCATCYTNFIKDVADLDTNSKTCTNTCYGLEACASLRYCAKQSTWCVTCIQPALNRYNKCLGGPVENQLNMEDVMRKMVHVWGSLY